MPHASAGGKRAIPTPPPADTRYARSRAAEFPPSGAPGVRAAEWHVACKSRAVQEGAPTLNPRSALGNVLLAGLWGTFAWAHLESLHDGFRASVLLILMAEGTQVFFYLTRRPPDSVSRSPYEWTMGLGGTFCPLLLRPTSGDDVLLGQGLLTLGLALQTLGMLSLRRSIGIVPANRGIQTRGLYRLVRHPVYLAYAVGHVGYLVSHSSPHNLLVVMVTLLFQYLRIVAEERFLGHDPLYAAFMRRTRWQVVPFLL